MSFALKELSGLLAAEQSITGSVTGFTGGFVTVATARGAILARPSGTLVRGDRVTVRSGWAEKAPVASQSYPV